MTIVLDTNVFGSALLKPESYSALVLNAILNEKVTLLFDNRILKEYRKALLRSWFGFTMEMVEPLLDYFESEGEFVRLPSSSRREISRRENWAGDRHHLHSIWYITMPFHGGSSQIEWYSTALAAETTSKRKLPCGTVSSSKPVRDFRSGIDGTEAASRIIGIRELPIVFLTSHTEREYVERVKRITGYGYVIKSSGEFVLL